MAEQYNLREADKEEMSHDQFVDTILAEKEKKKSNGQYGKPTITEVDEDGEKIVTDEVAVAPVETKDRGLFDFMGKKEEEKHKKPQDDQEEVIVTEFEKVKVSEPEPETKECREEEKKPGLLEKLHRSSSSSSSSSDEEEVGEGGEKNKKKKGLKEKKEKNGGDKKEEKKEEKDSSVPVVFTEKQEEKDNSVPVVHDEMVSTPTSEEKKGFLEKIKEKLPGHNKKTTEEVPPPPPPEYVEAPEQPQEKKGILEKIKEKIPGYNPKTEEAKEKECTPN